jgi:hypothetical protein
VLLAELLAAELIEFLLAWSTNCGSRIFVVSAEEKGKRAKVESTGARLPPSQLTLDKAFKLL